MMTRLVAAVLLCFMTGMAIDHLRRALAPRGDVTTVPVDGRLLGRARTPG